MSLRCEIRLLDRFAVMVNGTPVSEDAWRHRRGADLVKLLALAPGHRLHREQVMAALWPDMEGEAATANLRKAIHFARRALGQDDAIVSRRDLLELWPGSLVEVDVERFEADARASLDGAAVERADGFVGELLPEDRYAEWTEPRRANLADLAIAVLRHRGDWQRILEIDRTDEEAHRALMRRSLEAGDGPAAVRQFQRLRAILRADLGVAPEAETIALFERAVATKTSDGGDRERAQTLIARGLLAWGRRDLAEAERLASDARQFAREHHIARELGEACALLGMTAFAQGRWHERFQADFNDALRLDERESAFVFDAHLCLAETALGGGDAAAIAAQARELLAVAERARSPHGQAVAKLLIGEVELASGRRAEARPWLASAADLFARANADSGRVLALLRLSEADESRAAMLVAEARTLAQRSELAPHLVTRVFARMIEIASPDDQMSTVFEIERQLRPKEMCGPCSIGLQVAGAIATARAGDLSRARRFLADAERLAGMWQGGPWRAATWEARAFVRLAEGDRAQAAALLLEAAPLFAQAGRAVDDARCRSAAAQLSS